MKGENHMIYIIALLTTLLGSFLIAENCPRNTWFAVVVAIAIMGCFIIWEIQKVGKSLGKSEEDKEIEH